MNFIWEKHTLKFYLTPMIHWPETMMTWEASTGTLLSGDAFGAFGAIDGALIDGQIDKETYEDNMLRYYANIVGKYSSMVQKALKRLGELDIRMICPSHGVVIRDDITWFLERYHCWSLQRPERGVVLVYGSMYGNTEKMMEAVARGLRENGVQVVRVHNIARSHPSYVIRDIWRYQGLVFGAPTYDTKLFPPMEYLLNLLIGKMIKNKIVGIYGTYGWSGGAVKCFREFTDQLKLEVVEPVIEARFTPSGDESDLCRQTGTESCCQTENIIVIIIAINSG